MGGIWRKVPVTYVMMWVGSLALAGFPFFAGFYSKDMILEAALPRKRMSAIWRSGLLCAAFLTAFASRRLLIMAFHGKPRASAEVVSHVHESPLVMTLPLVLAVGAVFSGWLGMSCLSGMTWPYSGGSYLHPARARRHGACPSRPTWVKLLPVLLATSGVSGGTVLCHLTDIPSVVARLLPDPPVLQ